MFDTKDSVVMVDATFLRKALHDELTHAADISFSKLFDYFNGHPQRPRVLEARCYDSMPYQEPGAAPTDQTVRREAEFLEAHEAGFVLRRGVCVRRGGPVPRYEQHRVETMMTADLVAFSFKGVKKFVLVTGNQDVLPGVEVARDRGATVTLIVDAGYSSNNDLATAVSRVVRLGRRDFQLFAKAAPVKEMVELFAFSHDLRYVTLIRKSADCRYEHLRGKWCGVGGGVEPGESATEAAVREFQEETGVATLLAQWRPVCERTTPAGHLTCLTTVLRRGDGPVTVEDKGESVVWHTVYGVLNGYRRLFGPGMTEDLAAARLAVGAFAREGA